MNEAIWGFIGVILGTIATIVITFLNNKHEVKLLNKEEYNIRKEKFKEFQIDNLVEIQELIDQYMRCMTKIHMHDLKLYKMRGEWGNIFLEDGLSNEENELRRKILIRTQRISSHFVRVEIENFIFQCNYYSTKTNFEEASKIFKTLDFQATNLIKTLGENLRDLYVKI